MKRKQVSLGYDASGKRIRKWITYSNMADFNQKYNVLQKELEQNRNPSDISFGKYAEKWISTYKAHKEINTRSGYQYSIDKCSGLTTVPIKDITKSDLQKIINDNADHPDTCRKIRLTLRQIFDAAVDDGIISVSPATKLDVPTNKAAEKRALTKQEREAIKTAELKTEDKFFLEILYYCGLRRGEVLALTRSDFDFKELSLSVCKSVAYDKEKPILKDTKTHKTRYVPIPQQKVDEWKKLLQKLPFQLFSRSGCLMTKAVYRGMWKRIEKEINHQLGAKDGLKLLHITPHMIRHDYATRLYYVPGISTKKKAEILGHSERLFMELYSHLDSEKEELEQFQSAMNW